MKKEKNEEKNNKKKKIIIAIAIVLFVLLAFLLWFFNRKFDVKFDPNNGDKKYSVTVKYNKYVNDKDIKNSKDLGEDFIAWYKVIEDKDGKEKLEKKPFDFKKEKITKDIKLKAVYKGKEEMVEEPKEEPKEEPVLEEQEEIDEEYYEEEVSTPVTNTEVKQETKVETKVEQKEETLKITAWDSEIVGDKTVYKSSAIYACEDGGGNPVTAFPPMTEFYLTTNVAVTWTYSNGILDGGHTSTTFTVKPVSSSSGYQNITATTAGGQSITLTIPWQIY